MPTHQKPPASDRIYAWFSAVVNSDTQLLSDLLAHGMPIDFPHPLRHSTALMEATRLGRTAIVQWLIERGASPAFLCCHPATTALHCAIHLKRWEIVPILVQGMASCNLKDANGTTPLHMLCAESYDQKNTDILVGQAALLIAKHCPLNEPDDEGIAALHHCVINSQYELTQALLTHGANPNVAIPSSGVGPLMIAAIEKNRAMVQLLLKFGADPHMRTRDGSTPAAIYPSMMGLGSKPKTARGAARQIPQVLN